MAECFDNDLESRLVYSIIVAGKSAEFASLAIDRLKDSFFQLTDPTPPNIFDCVRATMNDSRLRLALHRARTGNYTKIEKSLRQLAETKLDLRSVTAEQLEQIHGIGPKTARFFILWTRPDARHAALDVHVLRWLASLGYKVPKTTPQSSRLYAKIEQWFIAEADRRGVTPRDLDHAIWVEGSGHEERSERTAKMVMPV